MGHLVDAIDTSAYVVKVPDASVVDDAVEDGLCRVELVPKSCVCDSDAW